MTPLTDDEIRELKNDVIHPRQVVVQIIDELLSLRAVVGKLPKTADGEYVFPDMKLYQYNTRPDGSEYECCISVCLAAHTGDYYDPHEQEWEQWFSTREAALAAGTRTEGES